MKYDSLSGMAKKRNLSYLSGNEKLEVVTGYSPAYLSERFAVFFVFPGVIVIVASVLFSRFENFALRTGIFLGLAVDLAFSLLLVAILNYSHRYILTSRRVIVREGFLKIKVSSVLYDKVTHITIDQGFVDRFVLGHGTVRIDTAGSSGDEMILKYIEDPISFKKRLDNLIHQHGTSHHILNGVNF